MMTTKMKRRMRKMTTKRRKMMRAKRKKKVPKSTYIKYSAILHMFSMGVRSVATHPP